MRVLLLNTPSIQMTEAARALGRAGHEVELAIPRVATRYRLARPFLSRYISRCHLMASPNTHFARFRHDLQTLLHDGCHDVVLPFGCETAVPLSKLKDELSCFTNVGIADYHLVALAHDKYRLHRLLQERGFRLPRLYPLGDLEKLAAEDIEYPVVVKVTRGSGVAKGVRYARNFAEVRAAFEDIMKRPTTNADIEDFSELMVQEYVPGRIHDGLYLFNQGKMSAGLTQTRLLTYPLSGGISATSMTTDEPELLEYGRNILESIGWHGPCDVECKRDERDGSYKLLEINPRFCGTLGLSVHAGMNFPVKAVELFTRGDTDAQAHYRKGLKYKTVFPLGCYIWYQDKGNRLARFLSFFDVFRSDVVADICLRDPLPNVIRAVEALYVLLFRRDKILDK